MGPEARTSSRKLKQNKIKTNVKAACEECRSRKTKCDGNRPTCIRCARRGKHCEYEADPDEYRSTTLRRKCREFERQALTSGRLIQIMTEVSDEDAVDLLRRLRQNESVDSILASVDLIAQEQQLTQLSPSSTMIESSCGSAGSAATSSASTVEPFPMFGPQHAESQPTPMPQQHQELRPPTLPTRVRPPNPLAIDFLITNDESQIQSSLPVLQGTNESDFVSRSRTFTNPPSMLSTVDTDSPERERRSSAPTYGDVVQPAIALRNSDGANMGTGQSNAQKSNTISQAEGPDAWNDYYINVSSLLRRFGRSQYSDA